MCLRSVDGGGVGGMGVGGGGAGLEDHLSAAWRVVLPLARYVLGESVGHRSTRAVIDVSDLAQQSITGKWRFVFSCAVNTEALDP